jgi:hypothetical protein
MRRHLIARSLSDVILIYIPNPTIYHAFLSFVTIFVWLVNSTQIRYLIRHKGWMIQCVSTILVISRRRASAVH